MNDSLENVVPRSLLVHDGELGDLRAVLEGLGTPFVERVGSLQEADLAHDWDLILSTPGPMLALAHTSARKPVRIVISDADSKTLRASLQRAGIELMVRRPVHPSTLRGLILHALYRGPEKRRSRRVSVGAPVRMRRGWRETPCILADLSVGGCRLLASEPLGPGKRFTLMIPAEVALGKAYSLKARTVRSQPMETDPEGSLSIHGRFDPPSQRKLARLEHTILGYSRGPARLAPRDELFEDLEPQPASAAPDTNEAPSQERREHRRYDLEQRVVALDDEADRVLLGRDVSMGGMRVSQNPHLIVGTDVRLALHLTKSQPLELCARVQRDDGERGVVLRFHQLHADASAALRELWQSGPVVAPGDDAHGLVVSELLEVEAH